MADNSLDHGLEDTLDAGDKRPGGRVRFWPFPRIRRILRHAVFSSLTRRILFFNFTALIVLVGGILYLNQFREGLIDARVESLLTQGEIISGAIAASASVDTNSITIDPQKLLELQAGQSITPVPNDEDLEFPIVPQRVAPVLRRLISPTRTRARIYDADANLIWIPSISIPARRCCGSTCRRCRASPSAGPTGSPISSTGCCSKAICRSTRNRPAVTVRSIRK